MAAPVPTAATILGSIAVVSAALCALTRVGAVTFRVALLLVTTMLIASLVAMWVPTDPTSVTKASHAAAIIQAATAEEEARQLQPEPAHRAPLGHERQETLAQCRHREQATRTQHLALFGKGLIRDRYMSDALD